MNGPVRILMAEDTPSDQYLAERELRRAALPFVLRRVETAEGLATALDEFDPQIVLSDFSMPSFNGLAALRIVRSRRPDLPFILVSGAVGEDTAVEIMKGGAADFVKKEELVRLAPSIRRALAGAQDRAERRRAEVALRESEARFRAMFDHAPMGIFLLDPEGRLVSASPALRVMLGALPVEPSHLERLVHPEDLPALREAWGEVALGRRPSAQVEKRFLREGKAVLWGRLTLSSVDEMVGRPAFVMGMLEDVTEQRKVENQLLQAQKMEAVGRLVAGVAHDINNLLTVIVGYGDLVISQLSGPPALHEAVEEMRSAGQRAALLTRQLLVFSRKRPVDPAALDLNQAVSGMERMLGRLIGSDVRIVTDLAPALGRVRADTGQIEQVIMNLAINARDAMPQGGTIQIATANAELDARAEGRVLISAPGAYVRLSVADSGVGIPPDVRDRIFEPFFTTKEAGRGTGFGLATVQGIVRQYGGDIVVRSEVGRGTVFEIYLPRIDEGPAASEAKAPAPAGGFETILLVEDDEIVRRLAREVLRRHGYAVIEAAGGEQALDVCRSAAQPIHLLVTDFIMPGMNGTELIERARRLRPDLKVLAMSGYTDRAVADERILETGIPFLQKPFALDDLARAVRETLG